MAATDVHTSRPFPGVRRHRLLAVVTVVALTAGLAVVSGASHAGPTPTAVTTLAPTVGATSSSVSGVPVGEGASGSALAGGKSGSPGSASTALASEQNGAASASASAQDADQVPTPANWTLWKERASKAWHLSVDLLFKEWPSPLFEANFWNTTLAGLRVILPLSAALLLLLTWVVSRGHGKVPPVVVRRSARGFAVFGFLLYYGAFNPNIRHPGLYDPAAYFHHYLGNKFRAELEDPDADWLVDCTLVAEKQLGKGQNLGQRLVYSRAAPERLVLASTVATLTEPQTCTERFSEARWVSFRENVSWFAESVSPEKWAEVMRTRVPPLSPALRVLAAPLTAPAASEGYLRLLAGAGVLTHAATLVLLDASFGPVAGGLTAVAWGSQPFYPFTRGVGFLDVLPLLLWLCGLAAWRKRRPLLGGGAVALGVLTQPWTGLALVPWGVATFSSLFPVRPMKEATPRERRSWWNTVKLGGAAALTLTLVAGGVVSSASDSYARYARELEQRVAFPALDDVGLSSVLTNHGAARYRFQRNEAALDPAEDWSVLRGETARETRPVVFALVALVTLGVAALAWKRPPLWGALLGLLVPPLLSQPLATSFGLIPLALLAARRVEWAVPVSTAVAGCALLANGLVFPDDRAAALSGVLWVTTLTMACAMRRGRAVQLGPTSKPELDREPKPNVESGAV